MRILTIHTTPGTEIESKEVGELGGPSFRFKGIRFTIKNVQYWHYKNPPPNHFMKIGTKLDMAISGEEDLEIIIEEI